MRPGDLWRVVPPDKLAVDWVNSTRTATITSYAGTDTRMIEEENLLKLEPADPPLRTLLVFAVLFVPSWIAAAGWLVPAPQKWLFVFGGGFVGVVFFSMIYFVLKRNVDAGANIVVDTSARTVSLPRLGVLLGLDDVRSFQWITGLGPASDRNTDLNILAIQDGILTRFHVLSSPVRSHAEALIRICGKPLIEVNMPFVKGRRDLDRNSVEPR